MYNVTSRGRGTSRSRQPPSTISWSIVVVPVPPPSHSSRLPRPPLASAFCPAQWVPPRPSVSTDCASRGLSREYFLLWREAAAKKKITLRCSLSAMGPCRTFSWFVLSLCLPLLLLPASDDSAGVLAAPTSAPGGQGDCQQYTNKTCEECLKNVTCLWCKSSKKCMDYPVRNILPPSSLCKLSSARWGVCWVNFEALIIAISVVGGTILIALCICCYCCCCRTKKSRKLDKEDEKDSRQREQRRVRQEERRAEMKSRHDEIRKKYGLFKEENPYAKFEN